MWHPGHHARRRPDHPAVVIGEAILSYAALESRSLQLAQALHGGGLRTGDTLVLFMPNRLEFLCVAWAAQRSGLYYVAVSAQARDHDLAHILADSGAHALVTDLSLLGVAQSACESLAAAPTLRWLCGPAQGGFEALDEVMRASWPESAPQTEGSDMLYTSGTTGRPKGVKRPLSGAPLGQDPRRVDRLRQLFHFDDQSVFYTPAPLHHAAPLRFVMTLLRIGATVVLAERFEAAGALQTLSTQRVTHSQWVPTMFSRMLQLDPADRHSMPLPHHRVAIHSGAPCPVPLKQAMINWWGPVLHEYYSGTESIGFTHCDSTEWLAHPGTVGKPVGCRVHIVGENGEELEAGQVGSVYFSGQAPLSYHNDAPKTRSAHHPKGWATMGDVGRMDKDGFLYLTDRKAFVIVSGGVNIYPREIEECLLAHPAVADAAVFGVADDDLGETVQAVVQPRDPARAGPPLAQALIDHVREHLSRYKCPKRVDFVAELPLLSGGKVDKTRLRDAYRQGQARMVAPSEPAA